MPSNYSTANYFVQAQAAASPHRTLLVQRFRAAVAAVGTESLQLIAQWLTNDGLITHEDEVLALAQQAGYWIEGGKISDH